MLKVSEGTSRIKKTELLLLFIEWIPKCFQKGAIYSTFGRARALYRNAKYVRQSRCLLPIIDPYTIWIFNST